MSFDFNPQQQNNPEFDHQADSQTVNAFNEEKSKKPPVPLDDVALGVSYYYTAIKTIIVMSIFAFILAMIYSYNVGLTDSRSPFFQDSYYNLVVGALVLIIMAVAASPIIKSTTCFCRTPSTIYPNAKSTIVNSWGLWFIALILSIVGGSIVSGDDGSFSPMLSAVIDILYAVSAYMFMNFLSSIGKSCLPQKKGCPGAISLIMIFYHFLFLIH